MRMLTLTILTSMLRLKVRTVSSNRGNESTQVVLDTSLTDGLVCIDNSAHASPTHTLSKCLWLKLSTYSHSARV